MTNTGVSKAGSANRTYDPPPENLIFGRSVLMQTMRRKISKIASSSVPILIEGDSGTGKGLLARYIHDSSEARVTPFVKVNCAAIPGALLESELFGYEKGAFTGAQSAKPGRVESADGGTLFLDGINEIDMSLQGKLLQLLQDGQFSRIGGQEDRRVRLRVICATNRPLEYEIVQGRFRRDLFYRVNVVTIHLPSLSDRSEDIIDLAGYFLEVHMSRHNVRVKPLSDAALRMLQKHPWPGNIRELENLMERYVILGSEDAILSELLTQGQTYEAPEVRLDGKIYLKKVTRQALHDLERKIILRVLEANQWNRKRTASALMISYRALLYKIRRAGLPPKRGVNAATPKTEHPAVPAEFGPQPRKSSDRQTGSAHFSKVKHKGH
jgi:two-component system response regulator AtoC